jgi:hypothetical protein
MKDAGWMPSKCFAEEWLSFEKEQRDNQSRRWNSHVSRETMFSIRGRMQIKTPEPPRHRRVIAGAPGKMTVKDLRKHLADLTVHANEVKDYGCHGTGFSSHGTMGPGGASGATTRRPHSATRTQQRPPERLFKDRINRINKERPCSLRSKK